jgi:CBS domain-containing protein
MSGRSIMLPLREIMTADVVTVTPETTLREAMELLAQRHLSGAPVVSGGKLVGVVSATDLMAFVAALSGVPTERDTSDDWGEWPEASIEQDVEQGSESSSAFFSELWDDAGALVTERIANVAGPEWNMLEEHDVSEVMTRAPLSTLGPDASADSAADLMRRNGIHRVLITHGDELLGVVSALDIVKAAADHRFTSRTYAFNHDREFDERS